ncbi:MAG TPA: CTP synthase [Candidatus Saccharimonadales bacterium]|nr:CTP synthase [Candidatus Saccharimonadales bacterium]
MRKTPPKYIFVTGGVLSGVGKGITAASIGATLKARGVSVSMQKCDPYLNVDAGTLNPAEHGECFVTRDGAETDLDLGHYERFLDVELTQSSATLSGRLLKTLIEDERAGKFLGRTIQLVPHLTAAIKNAIRISSVGSQVHIVELGGTVGDYEGLSFVEAIREFASEVGRDNCVFVHVVYVPYLMASKEFKTKPAQNAIRDLRGFGISPDVIVARTDYETSDNIAGKLSLYGDVPEEAVALLPNADTVYRVPLTLEESGVAGLIAKRLGITGSADMKPWKALVKAATEPSKDLVKIAVVAKYLDNEDTYFSVIEALKSAAWAERVNLQFDWLDSEKIEKSGCDALKSYDGVLVPGGFGTRGIEGMVAAAGCALTHGIPYLGLCLGLQVAVIAAARRGGLKTAASSEQKPYSKTPVIYIMDDQKGLESTGGTMRLGDYPAELTPGSLVHKLYGQDEIIERHRHRYEVNREFEDYFVKGGLRVSGQSPSGRLVEFVEAGDHPFFIATQAHPEFRSRPMRPHPLFSGFIEAAKRAK